MTTLDLICPIYHVDWDVFTYCVESWLELPKNNIIIGLSNPDENERQVIEKYLRNKFENVYIIDQFSYRTLGFCLSELIRYIKTDWFAYVHSDVELTKNCFKIIESEMSDDVGIIESERLHCDKVKYTYDPYHFSPRAYSGFQVMQKKAVQCKLEDDYVYRNEDMIFQNICEQRVFKYIKSWAMHVHYLTTTKLWTHERNETYEMQWKGLVKYTVPTDITIQAVLDALHVCVSEFKKKPSDILKEMDQLDPTESWKNKILEKKLSL